MLPKLFPIGSFFLPAYGLLVATGVFLALVLVRRLANREGMDGEHIFDLGISIVIAGLVGAKALLVFTEPTFLDSWASAWSLLRSGGVFYGGLIGGTLAAVYYLRKYKLPFWATADLFAVGLPLAHAFGRLGCFAAGCCWGDLCRFPWAVTFTSPDAHALTGVPLGIPLHPTQLYEALFLAALFAFVYWLYPRRRFPGQVLCTYGILYAGFRFLVEFLRGDPRGGLGAFSTSQLIAAAVFLAAVAGMVRGIRSPRR